ncbi:VP1 [Dinovernavirus aedis]|uniref:Putative structural protein VP1 n=1 Tax=Aedes pseudoscutellaris reovirus (isolate France) TaxID=648170 RepID=VP1_APRVF|nr:VP1 [Aedes pseudoscutellaris reovirus]Q2Y0F0.1 RecName: Full=Putative structural protein VP1 [Aedes pseudoscutellaris reovirus isolate France]AAZ94068.1 VP1 [Aedes pseudoscutellaris reovirus]
MDEILYNDNVMIVNDEETSGDVNNQQLISNETIANIQTRLKQLQVSSDSDLEDYINARKMLIEMLNARKEYIPDVLSSLSVERLKSIDLIVQKLNSCEHSIIEHANILDQLQNEITSLKTENEYIVRLNDINAKKAKLFDDFNAKYEDDVGPLYVYAASEDVRQAAIYLSYMMRMIITFENETIESNFIVSDSLYIGDTILNVTISTDLQLGNRTVNVTMDDISESFVILEREYIELYLTRHVHKILNNTISYSTALVIFKRTVEDISIPSQIVNTVLFQQQISNSVTVKDVSKSLVCDFKIDAETELYILLPTIIPDSYSMDILGNQEFMLYLSDLYAFNLLQEILDVLYIDQLEKGLENEDNRAIEQLTLQNAQSIRYILNTLQYVPLYKPYDILIENGILNSIEYAAPLMYIKNEYISKNITRTSDKYTTDRVIGAHVLSGSNMDSLPNTAFKQKLFMNTQSVLTQENPIYEDTDIIIYAVCVISREYDDTICGSGYTYTTSNMYANRSEFIRMNGCIADSVPVKTSTIVKCTYSLIDANRIGLLYNKTRTNIKINQILICFKNSFAVPTSLNVAMDVKIQCLKKTETLSVTQAKPSQILLENGISYFGIICDISFSSDYVFDGNESINFTLQPNTNISGKKELVMYGRQGGGMQISDMFQHKQDSFEYSIKVGLVCNSTQIGMGQWFEIFSTLIQGEFIGNIDTLRESTIRGISNIYDFTDVREFLHEYKISIVKLSIQCLRAMSAGVQDVIVAYSHALSNIDALILDITVEMNDFSNRLTTLEDKVKDIEKWIQNQIDSQNTTIWGSLLDTFVNLIIATALGYATAGIGVLVTKISVAVLSFTSRALTSIARGLQAAGHKVSTLFKLHITQPFLNGAHSLKLLTQKFNAVQGNLTKYERKYITALELSEANNYAAIAKYLKNLNPEIKLAEAINHKLVYSSRYVNPVFKLGNEVMSTVEINYHGLTAIGKLPQLRTPTKKLLSSDFGTTLMKKNKAPAHAYMVITDVDARSEYDLVTKYILGVSEGFTSTTKHVTAGSFKLQYEFRKHPTTNKTTVSFSTYQDTGYTAEEVKLLFNRYFKNRTNITNANQQWELLSSKFMSLQTSTLNSQRFVLPTSHRTTALYEAFKNTRRFDYNLLTNNCQNFCQDSLNWLENGVINGSLIQHSDQLAIKYVNALRGDLSLI